MSQILIDLSAFHKPQIIPKSQNCVVSFLVLPPKRKSIFLFLFSLLVSRSMLYFFSSPYGGGTLSKSLLAAALFT